MRESANISSVNISIVDVKLWSIVPSASSDENLSALTCYSCNLLLPNGAFVRSAVWT